MYTSYLLTTQLPTKFHINAGIAGLWLGIHLLLWFQTQQTLTTHIPPFPMIQRGLIFTRSGLTQVPVTYSTVPVILQQNVTLPVSGRQKRTGSRPEPIPMSQIIMMLRAVSLLSGPLALPLPTLSGGT